jgi:hypothetical protein
MIKITTLLLIATLLTACNTKPHNPILHETRAQEMQYEKMRKEILDADAAAFNQYWKQKKNPK